MSVKDISKYGITIIKGITKDALDIQKNYSVEIYTFNGTKVERF